MQINSAITHRIFPFAEQILWVACPVLMFAFMFGHVNGIVNSSLALIGIGTILSIGSPKWQSLLRWPLIWPIAVWLGWSLVSVSWSPYPAISMRAWLDEILYPSVVFWGFWMFGMRLRRPDRVILILWVACVLLALLSAYYWGKLQPPTPNTFPIRFYNRVGHTSTLAIFAMLMFVAWFFNSRQWLIGVIGIGCCLFIGLASLNRFFWPAAAASLLIAFYPWYWKRLNWLIIACIFFTGTLGMLAISSSLRYQLVPPPVSQDSITGTSNTKRPDFFAGLRHAYNSDIRPQLWEFYSEAGLTHKWLGVGFGKPLPGIVYRDKISPELLKREPQALTHAHNLFLNTWLQTGFIGLTFQIILFACLMRSFWKIRSYRLELSMAGIALVVAMVTKNMVDDFMWQTTMISFWACSGLLLGVGNSSPQNSNNEIDKK